MSYLNCFDFPGLKLPCLLTLFLLLSFVVQVMGLLQVLVYNAASKLDYQRSHSEQPAANFQNQGGDEASGDAKNDPPLSESNQEDITPTSDGKKTVNLYNIFLKLPDSDLHNLCSLLGREGYYSYPSLVSYTF